MLEYRRVCLKQSIISFSFGVTLISSNRRLKVFKTDFPELHLFQQTQLRYLCCGQKQPSFTNSNEGDVFYGEEMSKETPPCKPAQVRD